MANNNGFGAQNAAMYGGMNGPVMPSAGQYADMQLLMTTIETLSSQLESNREQMNRLQDGLVEVERKNVRSTSEGQQPSFTNGEIQPSQDQTQFHQSQQHATITQLQLSLDAANSRIESLERNLEDHSRLQNDYDAALDDIVRRVRAYCFEQQNHISALHAHYNALLGQSRNETVEAQLTHQAWQASLQRVSEAVRMAVRARESEGATPWRSKVAALKEENRVLRAKVGWDPLVDSEDEGDEVAVEEVGRGGGGSGGGGNGNGNGNLERGRVSLIG